MLLVQPLCYLLYETPNKTNNATFSTLFPSGTLVLLQTSLINLKQYKSEHYVSYLTAQVSPITPMNHSVIISKRYHYLFAEINWLLIVHKLLHPTSCLHHLLPPKRHNPQMAKLRRTLSYDIPFARTNKFKNSLVVLFGLFWAPINHFWQVTRPLTLTPDPRSWSTKSYEVVF